MTQQTKFFKVTLTYQFEFNKETYDASIWLMYKATELCGGCEARQMGFAKLQNLAQALKESGYKILAVKDITIKEVML